MNKFQPTIFQRFILLFIRREYFIDYTDQMVTVLKKNKGFFYILSQEPVALWGARKKAKWMKNCKKS